MPSKKSSTRARRQDAIALLKEDHQKVLRLFEDFEKARNDDRKQTLAQQICTELTVHATIEEEIFYPAARGEIKEEDLLDEATVEHASAKELIAQIQSSGPDDELWSAKVTVLGEYIRHHVKEEQNELFPQVRKADLDLQALGEQLLQRKQELMSQKGSPVRGGRQTRSATQGLSA